MTYNIHTNSEIQDVILDAKHVVTGRLGKLVSVKKKKQIWAFIQNVNWRWNAKCSLKYF